MPKEKPGNTDKTAKTTGKSKAEADKPDAVKQPKADEPVADNPLHKKLGIRPGTSGLVVAPPDDEDNPLLPLPESFSVIAQLEDLPSTEGPFDCIFVFARDQAALAAAFSALRDKLTPTGSLWISWMKLSGRMGGTFGNLNETLIRRLALTHALVDIKIVPLDRDWSSLRLVHRKH